MSSTSNVSMRCGDFGTSLTPSMSKTSGGSTTYRGSVTFSSSLGTGLVGGASAGVMGRELRGSMNAVQPVDAAKAATNSQDRPRFSRWQAFMNTFPLEERRRRRDALDAPKETA